MNYMRLNCSYFCFIWQLDFFPPSAFLNDSCIYLRAPGISHRVASSSILGSCFLLLYPLQLLLRSFLILPITILLFNDYPLFSPVVCISFQVSVSTSYTLAFDSQDHSSNQQVPNSFSFIQQVPVIILEVFLLMYQVHFL